MTPLSPSSRRRSISGNTSPAMVSPSHLRTSSSTFSNQTTTNVTPPREYSKSIFSSTIPRSFAEERAKHNEARGGKYGLINQIRRISYSVMEATTLTYTFHQSNCGDIRVDEHANARKSRKWVKSALMTLLIVYIAALTVSKQYPTSSLASVIPMRSSTSATRVAILSVDRHPMSDNTRQPTLNSTQKDTTKQDNLDRGVHKKHMELFREERLYVNPQIAVDVRVVRERNDNHAATIIFLHVRRCSILFMLVIPQSY